MSRVTVAALVAGVLGGLLLFLFEEWYTRTLGVLGLFAFIVLGVFAIATPSFLDDEHDA